MKARRVKGLEPDGLLIDAAEKIVTVRLGELMAFAPKVFDPSEVKALHDLRIAAKRLRYVLEVTGDLFGPYAAKALDRTKDLQDLVGEIHDCDELVPRVLALVKELRREDVSAVVKEAGRAKDLDPALAAAAPNAEAYRGLEVLVVHLRARREQLFARFLAFWTELEREGFRARLEYAISERPAAAA
jgi:CHAD domain-containing protein